MSLGAADDRLDAGDQLAPVERLGQIIVSAEAQTLDLAVEFTEAGKDEDRSVNARAAQTPQYLVSVNIRQHQIQQDDVVVIELSNLEAVFPEICRIDDVTFRFKHQLDALGSVRIVFDQQNAHGTH